jgi:hypothetical protein
MPIPRVPAPMVGMCHLFRVCVSRIHRRRNRVPAPSRLACERHRGATLWPTYSLRTPACEGVGSPAWRLARSFSGRDRDARRAAGDGHELHRCMVTTSRGNAASVAGDRRSASVGRGRWPGRLHPLPRRLEFPNGWSAAPRGRGRGDPAARPRVSRSGGRHADRLPRSERRRRRDRRVRGRKGASRALAGAGGGARASYGGHSGSPTRVSGEPVQALRRGRVALTGGRPHGRARLIWTR